MTTPTRLPLPAEGAPDDATLRTAVEALAGGGRVVVPTETVYGLAVRADDPALRATLAGGPFSLHVASAEGLVELVELPRLVQRLAARYVPGPLTLVVRTDIGGAAASGLTAGLQAVAADGWSGLRAPAHAGTRALLDACPFPVLVTTLGADGRPATDAAAALEPARAAGAALVLDGGPSALGQPSTVLAVGRGRFELLREGIVAADALRSAAGQRILFVCTGNTCRSPMAETLARAALRRALGTDDEEAFGFGVGSAGVYAGPGSPASDNAVVAMADRGLDLTGHASRPATDREVAAQDRVYCLTASHREALLSVLPPSFAPRVELLDPEGDDVPDPFGGPLEVYRRTAEVIEGFVERRLVEWVG